MYLKRIEIQGFKSLADKIELQFNLGVSGVVGPNGSGKSNIADAVRWVLGEQSAKSLRGAKMEDVIFSGSDRRKPVGMSEVSLTLDNSTSVFPLDFAEITVTRRVYRSGESEYYINKSPCRLRDIHELFMDTGIGREGYSIIGQGKIDEILNAKPEERRVIIEEAAGIIKYKTRKQQAAKKLNDTEQNLVRINDIITELENQVGPLEEQSQKAREYLAYKAELTDLEVNLLINQIIDQKEKLKDIAGKGELLSKEVIEAETSLRGSESVIEEHKLQTNKLDEELSQLLGLIYETSTMIEKKEAEIMVARERLNSCSLQRENLEQEIEALISRQNTEKTRHSGDERALVNLRDKIEAEEVRLQQLELQLSRMEADLSEEQQGVEEKKSDIIDLLNEMAGVKNSISTSETEMQSINRRLAQLESQGVSQAQELDLARQRHKALSGQLDDSAVVVAGLRDKEAAVSGRRKKAEDRLAAVRGGLSAARDQLQQKASRLKALQELQSGYEGYYRGVREVLVESKKGTQCQGVCGVAAEIIKVPAKFETAVEAALAGSLQNIITETDIAARNAIEFLKRNRSGRATFLPLNTIKPQDKDTGLNRLKDRKGFYGVASDLVEYDPKYTPAVRYLLGRVLVVEDIRTATDIARDIRHSMKIVTLEGDVVNPGGAMTGGAAQKGTSNLLGRVREIEDITREKKKLEEDVDKAEESLESLKREVRNYTSLIEEVQADIRNQDFRRNSLMKDLEVVLNEISRLEATGRLIEDERNNLTDELKNTGCNIENQKKALHKVQARYDSLCSQIEAGRSQLSDREAEISNLAEMVTEAKVSLAGLHREELNYAQIMSMVTETIREMETQVQSKRKLTLQLSEQTKHLEADISLYTSEVQELSIKKGRDEEGLNILRNEKQSLTAVILEKEALVKKLSRHITETREQVHASDVKKARLEFEIENSLNKLTEEFQLTYEEAFLNRKEITNRREAVNRTRELKEAIALLGNVNVGAIEEFQRVKERYDFLSGQYHDLQLAKESLYKVIAEMEQIMAGKFREAFGEIRNNFSEVFLQLFGGGKAELILTEAENLLESGVDILAQPPGKKTQHLSLLSGGERALTAIALLFAILKSKPSPFCILDEIEASLDEANVDRFALYLREFAQKTQFIVITHRKGTMEAADALYGVTMDESGVSKLVSMKLGEKVNKVS